ncbi:MAG: hypothetical protein ACK559_03375, partial [bacterium]
VRTLGVLVEDILGRHLGVTHAAARAVGALAARAVLVPTLTGLALLAPLRALSLALTLPLTLPLTGLTLVGVPALPLARPLALPLALTGLSLLALPLALPLALLRA